MTEIERKFVADVAPADLPAGQRIRQAYLAVDGDTEVRVRDRADRCTLTVKSGHGLERDEVEIVLDRATFDQLWAVAATRRIEKVRSELRLDDDTGERERVVAEVDVYDGDLAGLVVVEVEFTDRSAAEAFAPPDWFGTEVTGEPAWSNASLATHGRPATPTPG